MINWHLLKEPGVAVDKHKKQDRDIKPRRTRREVIRAAAYVAPAILTLAAAPAFAKKGTGGKDDWDDDWH